MNLSSPLSTAEAFSPIEHIDPVEDFFALTKKLRSLKEPFIIATVVEVIGSASARIGSKAVFDGNGINLLGWVGGGCAERFISEECLLALRENRPRISLADLDDEIFGLGVACGGKMRVFIDPIIPAERVSLPLSLKYQKEINTLCGFYGWYPQPDSVLPQPQSVEDLLLSMCFAVAKQRKLQAQSLRIAKKVPARFSPTSAFVANQVTIVGRTRITEALARHFSLLNFSVRIVGPGLNPSDYPSSVSCSCLEDGYGSIGFSQGEVVIVAGHTAGDPKIVEKALRDKASYVAMVGSYQRSVEVLSHLNLIDQQIEYPLFVPAGVDIDARNPDEIALSIVVEVILAKNGKL